MHQDDWSPTCSNAAKLQSAPNWGIFHPTCLKHRIFQGSCGIYTICDDEKNTFAARFELPIQQTWALVPGT